MDTPQFPEHDKREAVEDREAEIREFLEWLDGREFTICRMDESFYPVRFAPISQSSERLMADYLGYDLDEIERERRMILHLNRELNRQGA